MDTTLEAPDVAATTVGGDDDRGITLRFALLAAGLLVTVLAIVAIVLASYVGTQQREGATSAAGAPAGVDTGTAAAAESAAPFTSFAGETAADAPALAAAHVPYDATLPAAPPGPVAHVTLTIKDRDIPIAPGVTYHAWTFDGHGAPGPAIHVRQGQTVVVTLRNGGTIPHSIDFHAARIAPNVAFGNVEAGRSFSFRFVARDPGVFMYHCGTAPVLAHIANGMYGAIVVEPAGMPHADRQYVLVSSEWYLGSNGVDSPAYLDLAKARAMLPDWVTWNGYAGQYRDHPLSAEPGDTVRFWVVAAGPSLRTDFHVVGTLLDRAWVDQDLRDAPQHGVQTVSVPAGGGGVFDVRIDEPGLYPFVSHSFASADLGQVGLLDVGHVHGTTSH